MEDCMDEYEEWINTLIEIYESEDYDEEPEEIVDQWGVGDNFDYYNE